MNEEAPVFWEGFCGIVDCPVGNYFKLKTMQMWLQKENSSGHYWLHFWVMKAEEKTKLTIDLYTSDLSSWCGFYCSPFQLFRGKLGFIPLVVWCFLSYFPREVRSSKALLLVQKGLPHYLYRSTLKNPWKHFLSVFSSSVLLDLFFKIFLFLFHLSCCFFNLQNLFKYKCSF
jgi:hypothetical protein